METFIVALQQRQSNCNIVRNDRVPGLPSSQQKNNRLSQTKIPSFHCSYHMVSKFSEFEEYLAKQGKIQISEIFN